MFCTAHSIGESPKSGEFAHNSFTSLNEDDLGLKREIVGGLMKGNLLGQGSFGAVYEAYHIKDRKTVALKICSSTRKKSFDSMKMHAIDQVEQEVRILSALPRSPFIVEYLASSTAEESVLVSFALIQGENLHHLVTKKVRFCFLIFIPALNVCCSGSVSCDADSTFALVPDEGDGAFAREWGCPWRHQT